MTDCFCSLATNTLFSHFTCFLIISLLLQQLQDTWGHFFFFFNRLHIWMTRIDHPDQFGCKLLINQSFLELQEPDLWTCCASSSLQSLLHPFPASTGPSAAARGAFWSFFGHFLLLSSSCSVCVSRRPSPSFNRAAGVAVGVYFRDYSSYIAIS